jgi:hypothetical protein
LPTLFLEEFNPSAARNIKSANNVKKYIPGGEIALLRVGNKERLHAAKRFIGESIVQHPTLTSVRLDIDDVPRVGDLAVMRPSAIVGMSLDYVPLVAKDSLVSSWCVHNHRIRTIAEYRSFEKR